MEKVTLSIFSTGNDNFDKVAVPTWGMGKSRDIELKIDLLLN